MDIPDGVKIKISARIIEVEGPRGKLSRNFKHLNLDFQLIKDEEGKRKLKIDAWFATRKTSAAIRTALSHVENLITGVTKGYRYKMRFVYAHFPINASITNSNTAIEIRNFLGEKKVKIYSLVLFFSVSSGIPGDAIRNQVKGFSFFLLDFVARNLRVARKLICE
jgi:large subunit ribosomal protein L9e